MTKKDYIKVLTITENEKLALLNAIYEWDPRLSTYDASARLELIVKLKKLK